MEQFKEDIGLDYYFNITQAEYDNLKFIYDSNYVYQSLIFAEDNLVVNGKIIDSKSYYMTDEEYLKKESIMPLTECNEGDACWQTTAKRISIIIGRGDNNYFSAFVTNKWLTNPTVKSVDVIAMRFSGTVTRTNYWGDQYYTNASGQTEAINYRNGSNNMQAFSNGVGISMNLVDAGTNFTNYLAFNGYYSGNTTVYATYQHAKSSISVADSKKYTLSSSGLGSVLKFNSTSISNKYDGMQGIKITL